MAEPAFLINLLFSLLMLMLVCALHLQPSVQCGHVKARPHHWQLDEHLQTSIEMRTSRAIVDQQQLEMSHKKTKVKKKKQRKKKQLRKKQLRRRKKKRAESRRRHAKRDALRLTINRLHQLESLDEQLSQWAHLEAKASSEQVCRLYLRPSSELEPIASCALDEIPPYMLNLRRQLLAESRSPLQAVQLMPYRSRLVRSFRQPKRQVIGE